MLLVWGGSFGVKIADFLENHSIHPENCIVDDEYYSPGRTCASIPIISLSDFEKRYDECNIVFSLNNFSPSTIFTATVREMQLKPGRKIFFFEWDLENIYGILPEEAMSAKYLLSHTAEFENTFSMLADQDSKDLFLAFLRAKTGILNLPTIPRLANFFKEKQYFNNLLAKSDLPNTTDVFVDCGAYDGDSAEEFSHQYPEYKKIIAFEPDKNNFAKLSEKKKTTRGLECVNKGIWDKETELKFICEGTSGAKIAEGGMKSDDSVSVTTVDNVLGGEPATFIKMDIEGSELKALHGCSETIKKYMPFLAICVYHKRSDLVDIPAFIDSLAVHNDTYRYDYYLRHHSYLMYELVLYAVPKRRKA